MSEYITTALQEEEIKTAQEKLAELIRSDFARIDRMKADEEVTDFSKLDTITIGVMPGDGIGPLIMTQALRVLNQLLAPEIASGKVKIRIIEGEYIWGNKGIQVNDDLAIDFKVQTRQGSERIARAAFEYARKNGKHNVTAITKANIVKLADGNFLKAVHHIGETEYPDIEVQERLVDAMTAKMADPEFTKGCEVFVLPNLYGDIVTDAAAEMQGGLGSASSSNIGNKYALFEAIHGTAPFLINHGRGQYANPCSLIRAAGQLMAHIGYGDRTAKLEKALDICCNTEKKLVVTTDKDGATSEEFTTYLLDTLKSL